MSAVSSFFEAVGKYVFGKKPATCYFKDKYNSDYFEGVLAEGVGVTDIRLSSMSNRDGTTTPIIDVRLESGMTMELSSLLGSELLIGKPKTKQAIIGDVVVFSYMVENAQGSSLFKEATIEALKNYNRFHPAGYTELIDSVYSEDSILFARMRAIVGDFVSAFVEPYTRPQFRDYTATMTIRSGGVTQRLS